MIKFLLGAILLNSAQGCFRRFNIVKKVVTDMDSSYDRLVHQEFPRPIETRISGEGAFKNRIPSETLRVPISGGDFENLGKDFSAGFETSSRSFRVRVFTFKKKLDHMIEVKNLPVLKAVRESVEKLSGLIAQKSAFEQAKDTQLAVADQSKLIKEKTELIEHIPVFIGGANESYHWIDDIKFVFESQKSRPQIQEFSESLLSRFKKMQEEDPINDKRIHESVSEQLEKIAKAQRKIDSDILSQKSEVSSLEGHFEKADFNSVFEIFDQKCNSEDEEPSFTSQEESLITEKLKSLEGFSKSSKEIELENLKANLKATITLQKEQRASLHELLALEDKLNESVSNTQKKIEEIRKEIEEMNKQIGGLDEVLETIISHTITK